MKKVLFFVLISVMVFSQQKNLKVADLQPKSENFNFPVVSFSSKPLIEEKINTFLQVNELEFIPKSGKNPFQLAATATNSYRNYVYFYGWKKLETPKNILSISIDGEATGAYPEGFIDWKNFDLRTGNYINIQDIFEPTSVDIIQKIVNKKVTEKIQAFLNETNENTGYSEEEAKEQTNLYKECLENVDGQNLEYIKFFFGKDKLTIVRERCSNHAMRALDELGSYQIDLPYQDIQQHLSTYGKSLLSQSEKAIPLNTIQNKLYKGKIDNQYPITLLIKQVYDDGSFSAFYWYDKNKKLIEWSGKLKNNHISIKENDYHSEELKKWIPRAYVEADVNGKKISGTWQDYKTKKYLTLELEEL